MSSVLAAPVLTAGFSRAAPPWRTLGILAVLVLAAHTLVLRTVPERFSPKLDPASPRNRTTPIFITRSIAPTPAGPAVPPPAAAAPQSKPRPKPAGSTPKQAAAQEPPALPAISDTAATPPPEPPAASESAAAEGTGSASNQEAAAVAAASAASAPAAAPTDPVQTPVTTMALPASIVLEYKMTSNAKGMSWHASAELTWQNRGDSYEARIKASALGLGSRSVGSTGQINAEGLAPTRYSEKSRSEVAAHFEPDKGLIIFSANTPTAPWVKGAQDRTSVFFQLAGMLAGNPLGFPLGSSISLYTVGPRDADTWTFRVETEEKLRLPFGEIDTLKLTRQPRREYDTKVEVWYAPSLSYLPVRNKITQSNGEFLDQQLSELSKP